MEDLLTKFMLEYKLDSDELVNSNKKYYKLLNKIADQIKKMLNDNYIVKSACGQGRKSECPWIGIFNKNITKSARDGIYYALLFKSDMSGFYLSLCLGMESFKEKFKSDYEKNLKKVSLYFRNKIDNKIFTLSEINLNVEKNTRGYGYEISNIVAKYYEENFLDLLKDIKTMNNIYENICEAMTSISYDEIIDNILSYDNVNILNINNASKEIEQAILEYSNEQEIEITTLCEIDIPQRKRGTEFTEIKNRIIKKRDYINSSKKQAEIGLRGELLVIEYEKQKMINNNRFDLINKIKWVSEFDDSKGYDIESYDFNENGEEYKIYIEVKTTESSEKNCFFISANEVNKIKKIKEKYWIYRVCNTKKNPVFYKINGVDFEKKFNLKEYTYIAEIN